MESFVTFRRGSVRVSATPGSVLPTDGLSLREFASGADQEPQCADLLPNGAVFVMPANKCSNRNSRTLQIEKKTRWMEAKMVYVGVESLDMICFLNACFYIDARHPCPRPSVTTTSNAFVV